ncbi:hypothetical protein [Flavobacterium terrisoli]|uniref:hypothetical protein n=1 Tax=Flavobacterium terrisoli TaxID=3242195 RepID=UPI002542F0A5|nr:hypothetical protein [Flavobacterium buctense]
MKTYYLFSRRLSLFSLLGILAITITSCGSYQNSSYYDGDGVYGNGENKKKETASKDNSQSDKYQEYFSDLNKDAEVFTNVDSYSSVSNDSVANNTQNYNENNSGWGSNPQTVVVNVYDNNWGYGYWNNYWYGNYWGWNSWYGPGWSIGWGGWYSPWYGGYYGYNNWYGYGYNGYYNNHYHHYYGGRRGNNYGYAGNRVGNSRYGTRNSNNVYSGVRGNVTNTRSSTFNPTRSNSGFNPSRSNTVNPVRSNTYSNTNSSPRPNTNTSTPRGNVRTESTPRSYAPSTNYGGGRSTSSGGGGGSYGGGRSSGGGGRR